MTVGPADVRNFEVGQMLTFVQRSVWWKPWTWRIFRPKPQRFLVTSVERIHGVVTMQPAPREVFDRPGEGG